MKYDFDEIIARKGTDCVKYDAVEELWGRNDLLPMWVADMDFRTPDFIINSIRKQLDQGVLGYTLQRLVRQHHSMGKQTSWVEGAKRGYLLRSRYCKRHCLCIELLHATWRQSDGTASCIPSFLPSD